MTRTNQAKKIRLIMVSGPAGAGRSTAIRSLEDLGFEAIDNLPLDLVKSVLEPKRVSAKIAIGLDTRSRDFSVESLLGLLKSLSELHKVDFQLLYVSCTMEVLLRRYSKTRRRHPFSNENSPHEGIEKELILLEPIRKKTGLEADASKFVASDLKFAEYIQYVKKLLLFFLPLFK